VTIALIDGDILAYFAAYNAVMKHIDTSKPIELGEDGNAKPLEIEEEKNAECLFDALVIFKKNLKDLLEELYVNEYLMAVKGTDNFRDLLYPDYKTPRHKVAKKTVVSDFVRELRRLITYEGLSIQAHGREADDFIRIWRNQCVQANKDYIVCSVDKDLKCIPGKYYHLKTKKIEEISELEALKFFYAQLLQGDPTDNIPGLPGIGPKTADKMLLDIKDEEEMQEIVVSMYMENFEEAWYNFLMANGKLLHIQSHPNDYFTIRHWDVVKEILG